MPLPKNDNLTKSLRNGKRSGITAARAWDVTSNAAREAAKRNHWRPSELAAQLAGLQNTLREVYGTEATRFLFEDRAPNA